MFSEHNLQLHGPILISRSNTVQLSSEVYCSALYFFNFRQAAEAEIGILKKSFRTIKFSFMDCDSIFRVKTVRNPD